MFQRIEEAIEFIDEHNLKLTENGATAKSSANAGSLLDLFSVAGSLRSRPQAVTQMFEEAYAEDALLAAKLAFYTRDVREGLGEREAGRLMFRSMAKNHPDAMRKNLRMIAEFGRYDDLCELLDTPVKEDVLRLLHEQLGKDLAAMKEGKPVSLLAKWLPSVNASSRRTVRRARRIAEAFGLNEREYRHTLSALRSYLNVTEVRMSAKEYELIDYEAVSSNAMNRLRAAFFRNDAARYDAYLKSVQKGTKRIHAGTLFPYDIVYKYMKEMGWYMGGSRPYTRPDEVLEAQWEALPDYVGTDENTLVMVDVSGSMSGLPMATSIGLGIYFAERNRGVFANRIMLFSERPILITLYGETLAEKLNEIADLPIGYNTDLEAAFNNVLFEAVRLNVPQSQLPARIVVISDNEIDSLRYQVRWNFVDEMKHRFEEAGYTMPDLILWNVASRQNTFLADGSSENVQFCSGQAASVFKTFINSLHMTPYEYMISVLNSPRYDCITV